MNIENFIEVVENKGNKFLKLDCLKESKRFLAVPVFSSYKTALNNIKKSFDFELKNGRVSNNFLNKIK